MREASMTDKRNETWSDLEDEIMRKYYPVKGSNIPALKGRFSPNFIRAKAVKLQLTVPHRHWTNEDIKILTDLYSKQGTDIKSLKDKFSENAIRSKASTLGIKYHSKWEDDDIKLLQEKYEDCGTSIPELRAKFQPSSITSKAKSLGLKKDQPMWTDKDIETLVDEYPKSGSNTPELKKKFTTYAIQKMANRKQIYKSSVVNKEHKQQRQPQGKWEDDDMKILEQLYPANGPDIPELTKKFSKNAIYQRAYKLGIKRNKPDASHV